MRDYYFCLINGQSSGLFAKFLMIFLRLGSVIYGMIIFFRNFFYNYKVFVITDIGRPVISVGNLTWGGVGKTPCVSFLAEEIVNQGRHPAILTRGYGDRVYGRRSFSDEGEMLRLQNPYVPIGVGANRVKVAQQLLTNNNTDVFILDDGFQHRKIKRDLNIVLIDSTQPFENEALIPAGSLRESIFSLKRADIVILTKSDMNPSSTKVLEEKIKKIHPGVLLAWAVHQPVGFEDLLTGEQYSLSAIQPFLRSGMTVAPSISFCSIGDPAGFEDTLLKIGIENNKNIAFPDHYHYAEKDISAMVKTARSIGASILFTTAKDAVKLRQWKSLFKEIPCWVLQIKFNIESGKDKVLGRVHSLLDR